MLNLSVTDLKELNCTSSCFLTLPAKQISIAANYELRLVQRTLYFHLLRHIRGCQVADNYVITVSVLTIPKQDHIQYKN